mmetsp:Transcript_15098/g.26916  ORF Transcript_15098/g.26916 Transcript_15098/m.26916 type:complete len:123 (+) Transcript_15098:145-513(+)
MHFCKPLAGSSSGNSVTDQDSVFKVALEPRSLLVFQGAAFTALQHTILPVQSESLHGVANWDKLSQVAREAAMIQRNERLSITMRCVANVRCRVDPQREFVSKEMREEMDRRLKWWQQAISQ